MGVPGAAQGPPTGGRPRARPGLHRHDRADGLGGQRTPRLRRGRAGDAAPGRVDPAGRPRRPRGQARPRRPARRRVRRPAPAAGARPHRRDAAQRHHAGWPSVAGRRRLRRTRGRATPRRGLPLAAHGRAPAAAAPAPPHPPAARCWRRRGVAPGGPGSRLPQGRRADVLPRAGRLRPRGPTAAREALLPTAAVGRRPPAH